MTAFVLASRRPGSSRGSARSPAASATRWSLLAGVFGASGVAAVVYGGQRGPLAPVVVSGSMYPAVAIGLAWMFLGQALTRRQVIGVAAALVGVAFIALD